MKSIIFNFQVHQPFRLSDYHFFEIGNHRDYFNHKKNARIMQRVAQQSYLPANRILLDLIETFGNQIKASFSISGTALDQFELYAPEVIESFQELSATGQVEFLGQTYTQSLASLKSQSAFSEDVDLHRTKIRERFGQETKVFANTGLIYSDQISKMIANMGFQAALIEGVPRLLEGHSINAIYQSPSNLKLLLRNNILSDDIALRFSQAGWSAWPLTADKYVGWLKALPDSEAVINLSMDYATFGEHHKKDSGIFEFLSYLFRFIAEDDDLILQTPSQSLANMSSYRPLAIPEPISIYGEEKDLSAWLSNEMQREALDLLYELRFKVEEKNDPQLSKYWNYLQSSDHFYYMNTLSEDAHTNLSPFDGPYEAFLRYMNILSDLKLRVNEDVVKERGMTPLKVA